MRAADLFIAGQIKRMDANQFWALIGQVRDSAGSGIALREAALYEPLAHLSPGELQLFQNNYDEQIQRSYCWELWAAAEIMWGPHGAGDDCFRYFRDWLISEGRATFEAALQDPDILADLPRFDMPDLEMFGYVAADLFQKKTAGELDRDLSTETGAKPTGMAWADEDLPAQLPRLWAKYRGGED